MLTLMRSFCNLFVLVPSFILNGLAYLLGSFCYLFLPFRKKTILLQIRKTIGRDWNESRIRKLLWKNYIHYASLLFEFLILAAPLSKRKRYTERHYLSPDESILKDALREGKGVVLIGGHIGAWEAIGAYCLNRVGAPVTVTVKLVTSPFFQKMREEMQALSGISLMDGRMGKKRIVGLIQALRRQEMAGIFLDQYRPAEQFVKFFGHDAKTNSTASILFRKTGAPLILIHMVRERIGRYRVELKRVIPPDLSDYLDDGAKILALNEFLNGELEAVIRKYPEQWLWAHRRFKENPEFLY